MLSFHFLSLEKGWRSNHPRAQKLGIGNGVVLTQDCKQNINEQVGTTPALEENSNGREENGEDDLADVAKRPKVNLVSRLLRAYGQDDRREGR